MPTADTEDLSAYANGALEFDARILDREVYNTPLLVKLECIYPAKVVLVFLRYRPNGHMTFSQPAYAINLKPNDWSFIPLWFYSSNSGFNGNRVTFIGVTFNLNDKDPSIGGILRIANILVTQ